MVYNAAETKSFFEAVLPKPREGAYLNIHRLIPDRGLPGFAFTSTEDAAHSIEGGRQVDVYMCMSAQSERKGHRAIRKKANAVAVKALWLDLDAKGTKESYNSVPLALADLKRVLKKIGLPLPSIVVHSGHGVHAYWPFPKEVPVDVWRMLAEPLVAAALKYGLKFDTGCTIDVVRVLRVPGTINGKGKHVPVRIVRNTGETFHPTALAKALKFFAKGTAKPTSMFGKVSAKFKKAPSRLAAGVDSARLVDIKPVLRECGFLRRAVKTGGKNFKQPLWNLTTLISTFCENGRKLAHLMSKGHPDYTPEDTDKLFDRKQREVTEDNIGWPSCKQIKLNGSKDCATCPHFSKGKSPLHVRGEDVPPPSVKPPKTTEVEFDDMPKSYVRKRSGRIWQTNILDSKGRPQPDRLVSDNVMVEPWLDTTAKTLNFLTYDKAHNRYTQVTVEWGMIGSTQALMTALNKEGVFVPSMDAGKVSSFMAAWASKLKTIREATRSGDSILGWQEIGDTFGFCFAGQRWHVDGTAVPARLTDPQLANFYTPAGKLEPWQKASKLVTDQKRPPLDMILASAFAAPLVRFTGQRGVVMTAYSPESGIGKTTAMKVAQAVWGDPVKAISGLDDTGNATLGKMSSLRSLPLYWDELKSDEASREFVTNIVFSFTRGRGKARMTQSAESRDIGAWQTMMVAASNESIADAMDDSLKSTQAGIYRLFEFRVPPAETSTGMISSIDAARMIGDLDNNFGHAGLVYAQWLVTNLDHVERVVQKMGHQIEQRFTIKNEERYWLALCTTIICGAEFANHIGLTNIDVQALTDFCLSQLVAMRKRLKVGSVLTAKQPSSVAEIVNEYLRTQAARNTLRTNTVTLKDKTKRGEVMFSLGFNQDRCDLVRVQIGDDGFIRINRASFMSWLRQHKHVPGNVIAALKELGVLDRTGRMGVGTAFATGVERVLDIIPGRADAELIRSMPIGLGSGDDDDD